MEFESIIVYRGTRRARCLSEKAYNFRVREFSDGYFCMGLMGVSAPSLHIESTDSMIGN